MKNLSIIIVSYNTRDLLEKAIASILPQLNAASDELIVVDNNSPDGSAAMVREKYPQLLLLALDKDYGYSYGGNRGFEQSSGKFIVITSSDIVFLPGSFQKMHIKMETYPNVGVVCPELIDFNGQLKQLTWQWRVNLLGELLNKFFSPTFIARYNFIRNLLPYLQRKDRIVRWVSGAVFMVRREIMHQIHGFDEQIQFYYEDTDLFERINNEGYKILFTPDIKTFHALGASTKNEMSKMYLLLVQSRFYYYQKHLSRFQNWLLNKFFRLKFFKSKQYREDIVFREKVNLILNKKRVFKLWESF